MIRGTTVRRGLAVLALAVVTATTAGTAASASDAPGWLCRAIFDAGVTRREDGKWIYTIHAGHDMRVHYTINGLFYGHGAGHTQDGIANPVNFGACR